MLKWYTQGAFNFLAILWLSFYFHQTTTFLNYTGIILGHTVVISIISETEEKVSQHLVAQLLLFLRRAVLYMLRWS